MKKVRTVFILISCGHIQEIKSNDPDIRIELLDEDNMKVNGKTENQIEREWVEATQGTKSLMFE